MRVRRGSIGGEGIEGGWVNRVVDKWVGWEIMRKGKGR